MRLVSFTAAGGSSWGAVTEGGIVDLGGRLDGIGTLRSLLQQGNGVARCAAQLERIGRVDYSFDEIRFDPVITDPAQIICIGLNYENHRLETKRERTAYPTVFSRSASSQTGHLQPMLLPPESHMFDYEGELAVVISQRCRRVARENAMSVIAGYACYNDGSIRDFQRHASQFHPGKNWPATGAFGPWLVTADEVPDPSRLAIQTRLNGATVQSGSLDQLIFSIPELIAYCSTWTGLEPGDVIVTGTPGGIGMSREPPLWMKGGDVVEVQISEVGLLRNTVLNESPGRAGP